MNFWASLEYAVVVMIGSCSVIGVVGAKYRNHYAQIVMVGISAVCTLACLTPLLYAMHGNNSHYASGGYFIKYTQNAEKRQ